MYGTPLYILQDTNTTLADEPNHEKLGVASSFSRLAETFNEMEVSLLDYLEERGMKATDVRKYISVLPLTLIQESHMCTKQADKLEEIKTLTGLFNFLNKCVWNFVDYHLLEYVVSKFGSSSLKQCMKQYIQDLREFQSHTTVYDFMQCWPGRQIKPPKYDDVTVKLDKDPKSCTVKELNDIRQNLCVEFWPRLSDYAKFVMYHYKHAEGCFVVTWLLPSDLASELIETASKPESHAFRTFFMQNQIIFVSVRGREIYVDETMVTPGKYLM